MNANRVVAPWEPFCILARSKGRTERVLPYPTAPPKGSLDEHAKDPHHFGEDFADENQNLGIGTGEEGEPSGMEGQPGCEVFERFQALVSQRHAELVRVSERILKNREEAEDAVQDTFALVWRKLETDAPENLEGYLFKAVQLNALKRRARRQRLVSLDEQPELTPAARIDVEESEGDPLEIDPATLEDALRGLPEAQQAVIRMKYYVGLSFREIGEALSISSVVPRSS